MMGSDYYTPSELSGAPAPDVSGQFKAAAADFVGPPKPDGLEAKRNYDLSMPPSLERPQKNEGSVGIEVDAHKTSGSRNNFYGAKISFLLPNTLK